MWATSKIRALCLGEATKLMSNIISVGEECFLGRAETTKIRIAAVTCQHKMLNEDYKGRMEVLKTTTRSLKLFNTLLQTASNILRKVTKVEESLLENMQYFTRSSFDLKLNSLCSLVVVSVQNLPDSAEHKIYKTEHATGGEFPLFLNALTSASTLIYHFF
jgi:hypothetical protein